MRSEPAAPPEILAAIRAPLLATGAQAADAPLLQPLGLLLDLAGEAMRAGLFVVQAEGGAEACLRPDFTVAIARRHIEDGAGAGRYVYEGTAFRAENDGDRPEEFQQIGLEFFDAGEGSRVEFDAEITGLAWQAAVAGGRDDMTLWLGDVGLFSAFVDGLNLPAALAGRLKRAAGRPRLLQAELARAGDRSNRVGGGQLATMLAGLPEAQAAALLEETWALAGISPVGGRKPGEIAQRLVRRAEEAHAPLLTQDQAEAIRRFLTVSDTPEAALAEVKRIAGAGAPMLACALDAWDERLSRLVMGGAPKDRLRFATALGHAFDYYDGLTFEVRSDALGAGRPVAVGGRYDALMVRLGGDADVRAVGCMIRPWRAFVGGET